ncbi:MAG: PHP domain-containing protein [Calditrichaeota bacterium]|nr:PHP domain-containing protein [Calditrichota bacterium]MBT7618358.1 PHP domain-containing protein [Calditrichota bacterium]MBT7789025.1 PHP domain-containing protein [Calditrichota bacterium]
MSQVDLHIHTTASDGSLTPRDIVRKASEEGFKVISITDHDSVSGLEEGLVAGEEFQIKVIPGVELSVNHESGSLHLLGYGFDIDNSEIIENLKCVVNSRQDRNRKILRKLEKLGCLLTEEDVKAVSGEGTMGRGHIATVLIQKGYVSSVKEAFDSFLTYGGPAYVDRFRLEMKTSIEMIHRAGGVAVWAHPGLHTISLEKLIGMLPLWAANGLDGLESDYGQHSIALRDRLRVLALENKLIFTGGSDFHGDLKPDVNLGNGPEGELIDPICAESLIARLREVQQNLK